MDSLGQAGEKTFIRKTLKHNLQTEVLTAFCMLKLCADISNQILLDKSV